MLKSRTAYEIGAQRLSATFSKDSHLSLSTADVPTKTENAPIVGEKSIHTLDDLKIRRVPEVEFLLAKLVLEKYFTEELWLIPQVLAITKRWLQECLTCKDNTFPQLLLLVEFAHDAVDRIYKAIVASEPGTPRLKPILKAYDHLGSTRHVDFDTTKNVYATAPDTCHVSHVVEDSSWESKLAQVLEDMPEVVSYVKNQGLGFSIPYTLNGVERQYYPDYIVRMRVGDVRSVRLEPDPVVNVIVEVSGENLKDKAAKTSTARSLWVPAVNNHGTFGRWGFVEITDPWNAQNEIRSAAQAAAGAEVAL